MILMHLKVRDFCYITATEEIGKFPPGGFARTKKISNRALPKQNKNNNDALFFTCKKVEVELVLNLVDHGLKVKIEVIFSLQR